jgi:uncharacterized protein YcnI
MPTASHLQTVRRAGSRGPYVLVALAVLALALPTGARAHVTLSPAFLEVGTEATILFETPNERAGRATTSLSLEAPAGIELAEADPPTGWELDVMDGVATWTGGRIENEDVVSFPLDVTARTEAGLQVFRAVQGYDDGEVVRWEATLTVLPASGDEAPSQRLGRALAAGAVGLAVIGLSLLVLWRVRRRSLQER